MLGTAHGSTACPDPFVPATRIQCSFVASAEKRTLVWLARRIPPCINSDHLTILGFLSQCLVGVCYAPR
jgi:hypothetical protein